VVAGDVVPDDTVRVEVVQHADAQLWLAIVAQLIPIVRLRPGVASEGIRPPKSAKAFYKVKCTFYALSYPPVGDQGSRLDPTATVTPLGQV